MEYSTWTAADFRNARVQESYVVRSPGHEDRHMVSPTNAHMEATQLSREKPGYLATIHTHPPEPGYVSRELGRYSNGMSVAPPQPPRTDGPYIVKSPALQNGAERTMDLQQALDRAREASMQGPTHSAAVESRAPGAKSMMHAVYSAGRPMYDARDEQIAKQLIPARGEQSRGDAFGPSQQIQGTRGDREHQRAAPGYAETQVWRPADFRERARQQLEQKFPDRLPGPDHGR